MMLLPDARAELAPLQLKGCLNHGLRRSLQEFPHVLAQSSVVTPLMINPAPESRHASSWNLTKCYKNIVKEGGVKACEQLGPAAGPRILGDAEALPEVGAGGGQLVAQPAVGAAAAQNDGVGAVGLSFVGEQNRDSCSVVSVHDLVEGQRQAVGSVAVGAERFVWRIRCFGARINMGRIRIALQPAPPIALHVAVALERA